MSENSEPADLSVNLESNEEANLKIFEMLRDKITKERLENTPENQEFNNLQQRLRTFYQAKQQQLQEISENLTLQLENNNQKISNLKVAEQELIDIQSQLLKKAKSLNEWISSPSDWSDAKKTIDDQALVEALDKTFVEIELNVDKQITLQEEIEALQSKLNEQRKALFNTKMNLEVVNLTSQQINPQQLQQEQQATLQQALALRRKAYKGKIYKGESGEAALFTNQGERDGGAGSFWSAKETRSQEVAVGLEKANEVRSGDNAEATKANQEASLINPEKEIREVVSAQQRKIKQPSASDAKKESSNEMTMHLRLDEGSSTLTASVPPPSVSQKQAPAKPTTLLTPRSARPLPIPPQNTAIKPPLRNPRTQVQTPLKPSTLLPSGRIARPLPHPPQEDAAKRPFIKKQTISVAPVSPKKGAALSQLEKEVEIWQEIKQRFENLKPQALDPASRFVLKQFQNLLQKQTHPKDQRLYLNQLIELAEQNPKVKNAQLNTLIQTILQQKGAKSPTPRRR